MADLGSSKSGAATNKREKRKVNFYGAGQLTFTELPSHQEIAEILLLPTTILTELNLLLKSQTTLQHCCSE